MGAGEGKKKREILGGQAEGGLAGRRSRECGPHNPNTHTTHTHQNVHTNTTHTDVVYVLSRCLFIVPLRGGRRRGPAEETDFGQSIFGQSWPVQLWPTHFWPGHLANKLANQFWPIHFHVVVLLLCCVVSATTSNRSPSNRLGSVRSMSRTNTFKRTRAPPSLQTPVAADSNGQPLRPGTPAVAQAARWWPRASNGRPHRQLRSLRRSSTQKGAESILDNGLVGKETNG